MTGLLTVGSLFSGGGGLDMAVEQLLPGSRVAWCAETDPHALDVYQQRWQVPNLGDLSAVDWTKVEPVDVLVGGYPCQPWSTAGRRKGQEDDRDGWPWFRDAIRHLGPRLVLLENVRGHVVPSGAGRTVGDLSDLGYDAVWTTLRASDVGAPHRRERWFCAAYPNSEGPQGRAADGRPEGRPRTGERPGGAGQPARHRAATPDAVRVGGERRGGDRDVAGPPRTGEGDREQRQRHGDAADHRRTAPAHPTVGGIEDVKDRRGTARLKVGALAGTGARTGPRGAAAGVHGSGRPADVVAWGDYGPATRRWEATLGRPAPAPTDGQGRLSPPFVEWMMGWPAGWVDALPRTAALRVLGNGVVPQQAVAAYRLLLDAYSLDV